MTALKVEVRVMFSVVRRIKAFGRCPEIKNRVITRQRRLMNYTMMMLIPIIDCVILKILKTLSKSLVTLRLIKGSRTREVSLCVPVQRNTFLIHSSCPRIIISHYYPYKWETNHCTTTDVGYHISRGCHSGKQR